MSVNFLNKLNKGTLYMDDNYGIPNERKVKFLDTCQA
jgi:hypothetical protein